jgi:SAM-dependent methyltransferase
MVKDTLGRLRRRWRQRPRDRASLHRYWRDPPDAGNAPERYATQGSARSAFLVALLQRHVAPDASILELGCNVGRNLDALRLAGWTALSGVEISQPAVAAMARHFPETAATARILNASIEEAIPKLADGAFGLVFTMAVLEHLHPDSDWVFSDMVRLTDGFLVTVEDEVARTSRTFPRRYDQVFEPLGLNQLEARDCTAIEGLGPGFVARVFTRP